MLLDHVVKNYKNKGRGDYLKVITGNYNNWSVMCVHVQGLLFTHAFNFSADDNRNDAINTHKFMIVSQISNKIIVNNHEVKLHNDYNDYLIRLILFVTPDYLYNLAKFFPLSIQYTK